MIGTQVITQTSPHPQHCLLVCLFFDRLFHWNLELAKYARLVSTEPQASACLCLPSAVNISMRHHVQLFLTWLLTMCTHHGEGFVFIEPVL